MFQRLDLVFFQHEQKIRLLHGDSLQLVDRLNKASDNSTYQVLFLTRLFCLIEAESMDENPYVIFFFFFGRFVSSQKKCCFFLGGQACRLGFVCFCLHHDRSLEVDAQFV